MKSIACTQNSLAPGGWAAAPCVPAWRASLVAKGAALIFCLLLPAAGRAQIDEIQVYTGEINDPGSSASRCTTKLHRDRPDTTRVSRWDRSQSLR